jgi:dipeptidyl aminopeptidase/acylaminoacyl peptidase
MKRIVVALLFVAAAAYADRWQPSDRLRIANLNDPQISPDGKSVAVVVTRANVKENRWDGDLLVIDTATGEQHQLTYDRRGVAAPRWSPDGSQLAFLANGSTDRDAKRQIWILPTRSGEARRITDTARGVQQYAWSPDGSQLAFVTSDDPAANEEKGNRAFEIGDDDYLATAAPSPSHIWLVSPSGDKARRLTSGSWSLPVVHPPGPAPSPLAWSPDGKTIAITRRDTPHGGTPNSNRVALVDVASGEVRRLTTRDMDETQPVFTPDGTHIAYWHSRGGERGGENAIWLAPASGGPGVEVTKGLDRNVYRTVWLPDGKSFITGGHDATSTAYWLQPLDGPARRINLGEVEPYFGYWIDVSVSKSGAIAFTGSTPSHPRELYVMSSIDSAPRQLTHVNDAAVVSKELGRTEAISWKNDGFDEDGVVTYPPDFDAAKKYPLVLYIHGGPRSSSGVGFATIPQSFAAKGWIVFQPNYRGSDNLGNAYIRAIRDDAGAGPGRDVIAGVEELKKRGFIDENRIAVGGWSYGGYMTSWMIGHYPIFKAAVSGAAVNNLLDEYVLSDSSLSRRLTWGSPFVGDNMKKYVEQSPITYASKIKTPTLIMSDTGDVRVPITQSYQMYYALKDNGVPVKFIAFPVSGHSPEDPIHATEIEKQYVNWFAQYLK